MHRRKRRQTPRAATHVEHPLPIKLNERRDRGRLDPVAIT
jgi:hypothetical protein